MPRNANTVMLTSMLLLYRRIRAEVTKDMTEFERIARKKDYPGQKQDIATQKQKMTEKYGKNMGGFLEGHLANINKEKRGEKLHSAELKLLSQENCLDIINHVMTNQIPLAATVGFRHQYRMMLDFCANYNEDSFYDLIENYTLGENAKQYSQLFTKQEKKHAANQFGSIAEMDLTSMFHVLRSPNPLLKQTATNSYYKKLIDEYISHLKSTPYSNEKKEIKLNLAYQAKKLLSDPDSAKGNKQFADYIKANERALSDKLNHHGPTILGRLLKAVGGVFSEKSTVLKIGIFSRKSHGEVLVANVQSEAQDESPASKGPK